MADERKADDDIPETRQPPAGLTATTAGDGITRTSQPPAGLTATVASGGITRTSQPPAGLTATTAGDGITRTSQPPAGITATTAGDGITRTSQPPARLTATTAGGYITRNSQSRAGLTASTPFSINFSDASSVFGGARGGGSGHRGFSPPNWRAPPMPMLLPPLGNPASRHAQTQGTVPGYAPLQLASSLIASPWQTGTVRQHGDANRLQQVWQRSRGGRSSTSTPASLLPPRPFPGRNFASASLLSRRWSSSTGTISTTGVVPLQHVQTGYVPPRSVPSYAGAPQGTIPANQQQHRAALEQHSALQANLRAEAQRTVPGYAPLQPTFGLIARPDLTGTGQHDGDATRLQQVLQGSGADGSAWKRRRTQEHLHPGQSSSTASFPREKLRPSQPSSSALEQQSLHGQTGDVPLQHAQTGYVPPRSVPSYTGASQRIIPANQQEHRAALEQHSALQAKLDAELRATRIIMKKPSSISAVDLGPLQLRPPISDACHISGSKACTENLHAETQGTVPGHVPLQPRFGLIASPGLTGTGQHDGDASRLKQVRQGSDADGSACKRRRTQEYGQSSSTASFPQEKQLRLRQPCSAAPEQQSILPGQTGDVPLQQAWTGNVPPRPVPIYAGALSKPCHAPAGYVPGNAPLHPTPGLVSSENQIASPCRTGTEQPHGDSGRCQLELCLGQPQPSSPERVPVDPLQQARTGNVPPRPVPVYASAPQRTIPPPDAREKCQMCSAPSILVHFGSVLHVPLCEACYVRYRYLEQLPWDSINYKPSVCETCNVPLPGNKVCPSCHPDAANDPPGLG